MILSSLLLTLFIMKITSYLVYLTLLSPDYDSDTILKEIRREFLDLYDCIKEQALVSRKS